jgi:hypothetical protein
MLTMIMSMVPTVTIPLTQQGESTLGTIIIMTMM